MLVIRVELSYEVVEVCKCGLNRCENGEPLRKWIVLSTWGRKRRQRMKDVNKDAVDTMNEKYEVWETLKSMLSNKGLGIKAKKCLYERAIGPTALFGAEICGMRSAKRRKVNVF